MDSFKDKTFKVIVLGEAGVGKSSLIRRYTQGYFSHRTTTTVGVDRVPVDINVDNETLSFQVLDTAGCFGFRGLIKSYMNNIDAVIFVYDLTNKESFACLPLWNTILNSAGKRDITKILVGNKRDLCEKREVQFKNAKNYADFEGMVNMEISVKQEESVDLVFQCAARELRLKRQITEARLKREKEDRKLSIFSRTRSADVLDEENEGSPKRFIRKLSLMVLGKKGKCHGRRESPSTPIVKRRFEQSRPDNIRMESYRWT